MQTENCLGHDIQLQWAYKQIQIQIHEQKTHNDNVETHRKPLANT